MLPLSLTLLLTSLLAVFKAPAKPLWYVAIAATEWGHFLAIFAIGIASISWFASRKRGLSTIAALGAATLFLTPLARAVLVSRDITKQFSGSFGHPSPREAFRAPARSKPLDVLDLYRGIGARAIRMTSHEYATVNGQALWLDLYQPLRFDQALPGVLIIHGGSWQSGARGELPNLNRYLAARGYIVASVDYRLAPAALFPAQRDDVFSAITYLKNHAKEIGLDKDRLVLLGRSAGGQIALSAAYAEKEPAIKGVIAFYAPSDLVWGYTNPTNPLIMNSRQVIETYLGGKPSQIGATYEASSPLYFVSKKTPPTLMIHGDRDELVSEQHEKRLSKALAESGRPYYYLRMPWATHGCDVNFSGPCGQLSLFTIERFLAAVMPSALEERLAQRRTNDSRIFSRT